CACWAWRRPRWAARTCTPERRSGLPRDQLVEEQALEPETVALGAHVGVEVHVLVLVPVRVEEQRPPLGRDVHPAPYRRVTVDAQPVAGALEEVLVLLDPAAAVLEVEALVEGVVLRQRTDVRQVEAVDDELVGPGEDPLLELGVHGVAVPGLPLQVGDVVGAQRPLVLGHGVEVVVAHEDHHAALGHAVLEALHLAQEALLRLLGAGEVAGVVLVVAPDVDELGVALAALGVHEVAEEHELDVALPELVGGRVALVGQPGVAEHVPELRGLYVYVAYDDKAHGSSSVPGSCGLPAGSRSTLSVRPRPPGAAAGLPPRRRRVPRSGGASPSSCPCSPPA